MNENMCEFISLPAVLICAILEDGISIRNDSQKSWHELINVLSTTQSEINICPMDMY